MGESITISLHAIDRFREYSGSRAPVAKITQKLLQIFQQSVPARFKCTRHAIAALANHDFQVAEYRMFADWVLVIVDRVLVTIHRNQSERWVAIDD